MADLDDIRSLLAASARRRPCAGEAAYLEAWQTLVQPLTGRWLAMAVVGGSIADRLAWVFQAGYQAACRDAFPDARVDGWMAYAASEDRKGNPPLPGVALVDGCLSGTKTWVAAAQSVRQLVIKVGSGPAARYLMLPRDAPGLTVATGHRAGFLGDLSQGRAHFDRTPLGATVELGASRIRHFGLIEPLHVYAALCGFVIGSTEQPDLVDCAWDCLGVTGTALRSVGGALDGASLTQADALAQTLLARLSGNRLQAAGDWQADQRLIATYSTALQRQLQVHRTDGQGPAGA